MTPFLRTPTLGTLALALALIGCESPFSSGDEASSAARGAGGLAVNNDEKPGKGGDKPALKACPESGTTVLYGGQHIETGHVDATMVEGKLSVRIVGKDWTLTEAHIDVATAAGNLQGVPGLMLHNSGKLDNVAEYTAEFDLASLGWNGSSPVYIATHAVTHGTREGQSAEETSWGYGTRYGVGWGMYFSLPNTLCQEDTGTGTGTGGGSDTGTGTGGGDTGTGTTTGTGT